MWIKNFALAGLAARHGLTAVNLVVDNDTVKSTSLSLPARDELHAVSVPFDYYSGEAPYEEYRIGHRELFTSFGVRARRCPEHLAHSSRS